MTVIISDPETYAILSSTKMISTDQISDPLLKNIGDMIYQILQEARDQDQSDLKAASDTPRPKMYTHIKYGSPTLNSQDSIFPGAGFNVQIQYSK